MAVHIEELNNANCKTYLLWAGSHAVLVDPVREHLERYRRTLSERGLTLDAIVETHTHADHLMIGRDGKESLGAPIVMSRECPSPLVDRHVEDGDEIRFGDTALQVLATPGHTPDSLSFYVPGLVLTGDALLIGGSGRTDFPGGDAGVGYDGVVGKLFTLPEDTVVWPAHDYRGHTSSTIGIEKTTNPRFAGKSRAEYVDIMANLGLPFPDRIQEALQVNQTGFETDEIGGFALVADVAGVPMIDADELSTALASSEPPVVIDVREPEEFVGELGHIEGALLVPMDALHQRLPKLAGYVDRQIVIVCRAGARSASAGALMQKAGFRHVLNLASGMLAWTRAGLPVQR